MCPVSYFLLETQMPTCPHCKTELMKVKNGISLCCPTCDYREYIKSKYWLPELRYTIVLPSAFDWSLWTCSDVEADASNNLVLSTGKTTGYAVSPQMINLTKKTTRYLDCTKVNLVWTHTKQTGKGIKYYASNDGGTGYRIIHKPGVAFNLPSGNELRQYKQASYDDLRIKIVLERTLASDTSPSVTKLVVKYNKVT